MNARLLVGLVAGWVGAAGLWAQVAAPDYVPMKVIQTDPLIYPREMSDVGVVKGEARIAVQIDDQGKLMDCLVTAYSHRAFADRAVAAFKRWRYEPARINGVPHGATADLTVTYEVLGMVVVELNSNNYLELRRLQMRDGTFEYAPHTLGQLDRIPTPKQIVKPVYPPQWAPKDREIRVIVEFYIDEQGRVRLPAVNLTSLRASDRLAAVAMDAVSKWEFEPPMSHGRPVLVMAQQEFKFQPASNPAVP